MLEFRKTVVVNKNQANMIKQFLDWKIEDGESMRLSEDETIIETVYFDDGLEMDIKCCGADEGPAWTEAVLFTSEGYQLACSDPEEEFFCEWELEYNGNIYYADVKEE